MVNICKCKVDLTIESSYMTLIPLVTVDLEMNIVVLKHDLWLYFSHRNSKLIESTSAQYGCLVSVFYGSTQCYSCRYIVLIGRHVVWALKLKRT